MGGEGGETHNAAWYWPCTVAGIDAAHLRPKKRATIYTPTPPLNRRGPDGKEGARQRRVHAEAARSDQQHVEVTCAV